MFLSVMSYDQNPIEDSLKQMLTADISISARFLVHLQVVSILFMHIQYKPIKLNHVDSH